MKRSADALTCRALHVRLSDRPVIRGLDATFPPGTLTVVAGPNGAGKSTLLRALAGLLAVDAGVVEIGDRAVHALDPGERGRLIAYLPQAGRIDWPLQVRDVVALGRRPHGRSPGRLDPSDEAAIERALALTDTAQFADRQVTRLSGGEQARVLLARAFAQDSPILIADEPTAGLDPAHQLALAEQLTARAVAGGTVIVALHDLSLAARIATSILVLRDGSLRAHGPAADALTPGVFADVFHIHARLAYVGLVPLVVTQGPAREEG